ncbi:GNAT family N-acetyltransferase [Microdochium nivale]|nr:GNAT family N-acetyltransferase [Microdochium nivale]
MTAPGSCATTTPRLLLVRPDASSPAHADFIVRLYNTPLFIASHGGKPTSITNRDAAAAYIRRRFNAEHERNGYGTYLLVLKPSNAALEDKGNGSSDSSTTDGDGAGAAATTTTTTTRLEEGGGGEQQQQQHEGGILVGTVSLTLLEGVVSETCYAAPDLGFAVLPEYCRQGIAVEASRGVLEWASREAGVDVVLGLHDPANVASRAVLRKLGFADRGTRRLKPFGDQDGMVWTWGAGGRRVSEEEVMATGLPGVVAACAFLDTTHGSPAYIA